jgi:hypothetical protein
LNHVSHMCENKIVFYVVELITGNPKEVVTTILFRWDLTNDIKNFASTIADFITSLEDTLCIIFLTAQLAVEFYSNTPT